MWRGWTGMELPRQIGQRRAGTSCHTWVKMSPQVDSTTYHDLRLGLAVPHEVLRPSADAARIVYDTVDWFRAIETVREIEQRINADVVFGHPADQVKELRVGRRTPTPPAVRPGQYAPGHHGRAGSLMQGLHPLPVYDYACSCGTRFKLLVPSWSGTNTDCRSV